MHGKITGKGYTITSENVAMHEWNGLNVKIIQSSDPKRIGIHGVVVRESKNVIEIQTSNGIKEVPKKECVFEFELNGEKKEINGTDFLVRPEERTKLRLR